MDVEIQRQLGVEPWWESQIGIELATTVRVKSGRMTDGENMSASHGKTLFTCTVLLAATACGTQRPEAAASSMSRAELSVRAMDARIAGTAQQQIDGSFLDYVTAQSALVTCFQAHGAVYQPPPFGAPEEAPGPAALTAPLPVAMSVDLDEATATIDREIGALRAGAKDPQPTSPDVGTESFTKAAAACSPTVGAQERFHTAAMDAWIALLGRAGSTPGALVSDDDYVSCMKKQGIAADSAEDAFGPYPEILELAGSPDSARAGALKRAGADADCRRGAHVAFIDAAAAALPEFETSHAREIADAESLWRQVSVDADRARATWYAAHPELRRL